MAGRYLARRSKEGPIIHISITVGSLDLALHVYFSMPKSHLDWTFVTRSRLVFADFDEERRRLLVTGEKRSWSCRRCYSAVSVLEFAWSRSSKIEQLSIRGQAVPFKFTNLFFSSSNSSLRQNNAPAIETDRRRWITSFRAIYWVRNNLPSALKALRRMILASRRLVWTERRSVPISCAMAFGLRIGLLPLSRFHLSGSPDSVKVCSLSARSGPSA